MELSPYERRVLKQTEQWADGKSIHNHIDGECCPDFSCCHPDMVEVDRGKRMAVLNKLRTELGLAQKYDS